MIRESEIMELLDDLDEFLLLTSDSSIMLRVGDMRRKLLNLLVASAPDEEEPLADVEPLPRQHNSPVPYDQAKGVSCPRCKAKRGEPCFVMNRRKPERQEPETEAKHAHEERKQKVRDKRS